MNTLFLLLRKAAVIRSCGGAASAAGTGKAVRLGKDPFDAPLFALALTAVTWQKHIRRLFRRMAGDRPPDPGRIGEVL